MSGLCLGCEWVFICVCGGVGVGLSWCVGGYTVMLQ